MDKFLKLKISKENELKSINALIDSSNLEIYKSEINIRQIDELLLKLEREQQKNDELKKKIFKFPKLKKSIIITKILIFIIMCLIPAIIATILLKSVSIILFYIFCLISINLIIGFQLNNSFKKIIISYENELKDLTIDNLEEKNNNIIKEKLKLNNKKVFNERKKAELSTQLEQYKFRKKKIQEAINYIDNIRNEIIERLCTETLDGEFETEQVKQNIQRVLFKK